MLTNWISPDKYIEYLEAFGFGSQGRITTSIRKCWNIANRLGFNTKNDGWIWTRDFNDYPIQHIQAISAILNGGQIIKPQLISQVYDSNTEEMIYEFKAELGETPITAQTAEQVKQLMVGVTSNKTGSWANCV